jgi:hypothetical protein
MRVELDMFSGRPNPTWDLPAAVEQEIAHLEDELRESRRAAPEPPPLGYRGLVYGEDDNRRRVFDGVVTTNERSYDDPGRRIERLLVATMPGSFSELRDHLPDELTG